MKRLMLAVSVLVLSTLTAADAQQPAPPMPMMEMCRAMMAGHGMEGGGMMGASHPMMGMMGDPRIMLEMRGEMMKAMGDIMLKYAAKMPPPAPPAGK